MESLKGTAECRRPMPRLTRWSISRWLSLQWRSGWVSTSPTSDSSSITPSASPSRTTTRRAGEQVWTRIPASLLALSSIHTCVSPGRDDCPADCVIYFGFSDIFRISTMVVMENVGQQKLRQMLDYCQSIDRYRHAQSHTLRV